MASIVRQCDSASFALFLWRCRNFRCCHRLSIAFSCAGDLLVILEQRALAKKPISFVETIPPIQGRNVVAFFGVILAVCFVLSTYGILCPVAHRLMWLVVRLGFPFAVLLLTTPIVLLSVARCASPRPTILWALHNWLTVIALGVLALSQHWIRRPFSPTPQVGAPVTNSSGEWRPIGLRQPGSIRRLCDKE